MTEALVTPKVLTWARQRRNMEVPDLASRLNVKPDIVNAWETGDRRPTFKQAQRFAQSVYVPFGYLYLSEPPVEELPIADFRTIPCQESKEPSPDLLDLLNGVIGKQEWFREYRESEGVEEMPFVGRFGATDSEKAVASDIRDAIDVEGARKVSTNFETFMRELTRNAEKAGIMVLRSGVVGNNNRRPLDVEEFRGFSISDPVAPLVFINARDFKGAQIFTFAHEMAHIWAGQGGISNPDYGLQHELEDGPVEVFCNRVAAETLVPGENLRERWVNRDDAIEASVDTLSRHYKVSSFVILRQANDHDFLTVDEFRTLYGRLAEQTGKSQPSGETGGNFHYTLNARNGTEFTRAVVASVVEGTLSSRDAADMLGVKVKTLAGIAEHHFGSPLNLG